jgi:hypothetical protein
MLFNMFRSVRLASVKEQEHQADLGHPEDRLHRQCDRTRAITVVGGIALWALQLVGATYVKPPVRVAVCPTGLVTTTSTEPAACAGVVAVREAKRPAGWRP